MLHGALSILLAISTSQVVNGLFGVEKVLKIDKFYGVCPGLSNLPIQYQELKLKRSDDGQVFMDLSILVKEDVDKPLKMQLTISKCNKKDTNKCSVYREIMKPNYCETIQEDSRSPLYQFFRQIKPAWKCPFKKGTYAAKESSVDVSLMMLMKVEDFVWKVKSLVTEKTTGTPVLCIQGEGHVDVVDDDLARK